MAKKPAKDGPDKLRPDVAETAYRTLLEAIGEAPRTLPTGGRADKNPEAVRRGAKGGKKGGKARRDSMTEEERAQSAKKASSARWSGRKLDGES